MKTLFRIWLVLTALLIIGLVAQSRGQELKPRPPEAQVATADVEVHVQRGHAREFDYVRMNDLYFAACFQVAARIHPEWSLDRQANWLRPKLQLVVGAKVESWQEEPGEDHLFTLRLKHWDEGLFTAAVIEAAMDKVLSPQQKKLAVADALGKPWGKVSVDELRKVKP